MQATIRRAYLSRGSDEATSFFDRTNDAIQAEAIFTDGLSLDEIERILIQWVRCSGFCHA